MAGHYTFRFLASSSFPFHSLFFVFIIINIIIISQASSTSSSCCCPPTTTTPPLFSIASTSPPPPPISLPFWSSPIPFLLCYFWFVPIL
ncbi:hypothetical protein TRSC58_07700 [Trypanosoma rangeli SC58]|uniref:Uncharacterized protein n=1 Tax=Trypanosoma rangeli SC58 TaxID=429131 RepID=A0A061IUN1_TRYRA|nr:hypothetical protein TRSC58_07700 [Trypanosoma rangeli SC58]